MNRSEYEKSLNLFDRHLCCDGAKYCLYPPRKGGSHGNTTFHPFPSWIIDNGDGGTIIEVQYCPFCGEKLEAQ